MDICNYVCMYVIIMYCNINCQEKHWKEGGHKQECKKIV